jgi:hypothetical protein
MAKLNQKHYITLISNEHTPYIGTLHMYDCLPKSNRKLSLLCKLSINIIRNVSLEVRSFCVIWWDCCCCAVRAVRVRKSCWCAAGFLFFQEEFLCISTGRYRGGVFSVAGSAGMLLACLLAVSSSAVFVFFPSCFRFGVVRHGYAYVYTYVYFGLIII